MREEIIKRLEEIEAREQVKILYAVESGSRAWGFASPDSDYDVRFLYVRPLGEYLRLQKSRDLLEYPVDALWDVCGWDLPKALRLMHRSNPSLLEWLGSPVVYRTTPSAEALRAAAASCFSKRAGAGHYLSMARSDIAAHLQGGTVQAKKYLYALRPVLACRWVLSEGTPPPVPFEALCAGMLPAALSPAVEGLLAQKRALPESGQIAHIPKLDQYLAESIAELTEKAAQLPKEAPPPWEGLDALFLEIAGQEGVAT